MFTRIYIFINNFKFISANWFKVKYRYTFYYLHTGHNTFPWTKIRVKKKKHNCVLTGGREGNWTLFILFTHFTDKKNGQPALLASISVYVLEISWIYHVEKWPAGISGHKISIRIYTFCHCIAQSYNKRNKWSKAAT